MTSETAGKPAVSLYLCRVKRTFPNARPKAAAGMAHWPTWLVPASAIVGTASASLYSWFYAGIFGVFVGLLFMPGLVAAACMFGRSSPLVRMLGWCACAGCLPVLFLAGATLAQYGIPRLG